MKYALRQITECITSFCDTVAILHCVEDTTSLRRIAQLHFSNKKPTLLNHRSNVGFFVIIPNNYTAFGVFFLSFVLSVDDLDEGINGEVRVGVCRSGQ